MTTARSNTPMQRRMKAKWRKGVTGKDMRPEESATPKESERKPQKLKCGGMAKKKK